MSGYLIAKKTLRQCILLIISLIFQQLTYITDVQNPSPKNLGKFTSFV